MAQIAPLHEACLVREAQTCELNAYNAIWAEQARTLAVASQTQLEHGYDTGPLHGIPVAVKANIAVAGEEMRAGSGTQRTGNLGTDTAVRFVYRLR